MPVSGLLQAPHFSFFSVACHSFVLKAAPSATATFRVGHISSSLLRSSDDLLLRSFSVGPVLRPGLNSVHFTQSDDTFRRSSLSAYPAIRSTRRFCRLQRHVVIFCLLDGDWCWSWVVGTKKFFGPAFVQAICGVVALKPHVPSGACGARRGGLSRVLSYLAGFRPPAGTAFFLFSVACPSFVLRAAPSATATLRVGHISFFLAQVIRRPAAAIVLCRPRASSGLELDPFHAV